ncbi:sugar phosphate isomerase/epimerase family protein [Paludisphaera mucosa]|uniref:Sugar phosphate isomerase/epimerase n=1 Tax=Paludisphaera mucosa TaxID=3030827 RepID=A0ABT6FBV4_9BACT|nr:sugar phosphate isomerase/epimerase [Paludisphaera mucosa]MDG3005070.1 sugar phosphate isomerase/epimerase [Paludisphaera mucosa]
MKPCISQATTMNAPLEADFQAYGRGGWSLVELWLTKVEGYLRDHSVADLLGLLESNGLTPAAAAGQGGLLLSRGAERGVHWDLFRRRLALLKELDVPVMVVAVDFNRTLTDDDYPLAAASLAEAGALAGSHGVKIALEFQKGAAFCSSLDTTLALIAQCKSPHVGVCLDLFHYYTGPSKFEDFAYLNRENLAWVQVCDLAGTPRELAGDADRIFPGEGDFQIAPILDHLGAIGYDGPVSLEVLNPSLWAAPVDRIADFGHQAMTRTLGRWGDGDGPDAGRESAAGRGGR